MLYAFLLNALFAATYPLIQHALAYGPLFALVALRMIIAATCLLFYYRWMCNKTAPAWNHAGVKTLIFVGLCAMYIPFALEGWAVSAISAFQVNGLYLLNPVICAIFDYWHEKQVINLRKLGALGISMVGSIFFLAQQNSTSLSFIPSFIQACAMAALLLSMILTAYSWFSVKKMLNEGHSLVQINGITMLVGGLASGISWLCSFLFTQQATIQYIPFLLDSIALAFIGNIAGFGLFGILIARYSLTFIALAQFTSPLFGALYNYYLFSTVLSMPEVIALIVIMFGIILFYSQETKKSRLLTPPVA